MSPRSPNAISSEITAFVAQSGPQKRRLSTRFMKGLHQNINPSITPDDAIQMLSQHLITKPVFDALFENYTFVENNPVSKAMQGMLNRTRLPSRSSKTAPSFTTSTNRSKCAPRGIDNGEARKQKIVIELYDKFFQDRFPQRPLRNSASSIPRSRWLTSCSTPWPIVLKAEFGRNLSDENIHILDPFTGTGTFITRLLQIQPHQPPRRSNANTAANSTPTRSSSSPTTSPPSTSRTPTTNATPDKALSTL
jgi:predicted helicase